METFDQYLQELIMKTYPEWNWNKYNSEDLFDNWLSTQDVNQIMDYAESWGKLVFIEGKLDYIKEIKDIMSK